MKNKLEIKVGNKVIWKKMIYEIMDINELYFVLKKNDDGKTYKLTEEDFYREYRNSFIAPYTSNPEFFSIDINTLDSKNKEAAIRISKYLSCFLQIHNAKISELNNIIKKVANDIEDPNPPCIATLYNWNKKYVFDKKINFRSLIERKIRISKLDEEVEILIKDCVNDNYLNNQKITIRQLHRLINNKIWQKNMLEDNNLKEPSYETVRQFVNLIDKKAVVLKRYGAIEAVKQYKTYKLGIKASRILEYVEIDHVFLDININYQDLSLGRPVLTLLIDNYSLSILGVYISFGKPNKNCVIQALKSAILPKEDVNKIVGETNSKWVQFGTIENLITDNGKEFHSNDFKSICLELGINIQYAPPYHPWYKRYVENYFSALNKQLISSLPGSYHNNIKDKNTLSYDIFIQILYTYIIDIYHNKYNQKKKGTPYNLWKESQKSNPLSIAFSYDELNIIMGGTLERSISKLGISIDNVYYNDENLNFIRRHSLNNYKVKIKRNWDDISYIYVFSDFEKKYIKVFAIDQEYTKDKTIFQHHCILKIARKDSRNQDDKDKIYSAVKKINDYLEKNKKINKPLKRHDKVLHYKNISSSTFTDHHKVDQKDKNIIPNYDNTQDLEDITDDNDNWSIFNRD